MIHYPTKAAPTKAAPTTTAPTKTTTAKRYVAMTSLCLEDLDPSRDDFGPLAVEKILRWAIEHSATDVHLVPTPGGLAVSGRVGGILQPLACLNAGGDRVVSRLKVLARLLTYKSDVPQEGRLSLGAVATTEMLESVAVDGRLATCPTVHGEKAVIRLFPTTSDLRTVSDLGFPADISDQWLQLLQRPHGLLLITGAAGSGKTTTAYASLRSITADSPQLRSIVSLEDPVEQLLDAVAQTNVGGTTGLTFASGLKAVLRHDPEVIFVGELRDRDTIETAIRAALTGHLVLATIHTGTAAEGVVRLFDADIEPFLILSGLLAVAHQRLAVCTDGHRRPLVELLDVTDEGVRAAVRQHASSEQIEHAAIAAGMLPCVQIARQLLQTNTIAESEFLRLFGANALPAMPGSNVDSKT